MDKGEVPEPVVLERDEALLARLDPEDRESFQGINVLQTARVWSRFKEEVLPALRIADNDFLDNTLGQDVPFKFEIDRPDRPFTRPALFLMGRQDWAVGYRDQWRFLECYPRASYVVLDKAGHNLQIEQDALFGALVREWLERVAAETAA